MKNQLLENLQNPEALEQLYRQNPEQFVENFQEIDSPEPTALERFWQIRLAAEKQASVRPFHLIDLKAALLIGFITALLILIPSVFTVIDREFFYLRNLPLLAINGLIVYAFWINRPIKIKQVLTYLVILLTTAVYINVLPDQEGDSVNLAIIHLPLLFWAVFGLIFLQFKHREISGRMAFIRFSGEWMIMSGLIVLAGMVLTVITQGLFEVAGKEIMEFYGYNIALPALAAIPVIAWFLIRTYPGITSRIAPVIARIFTPLVLVTLFVYLVYLAASQNLTLENRELLLIFNVMVLGVLGLIVFSISEISQSSTGKFSLLMLFLLAVLAIIANSIALAAISGRVFEGLTPNRTVVLVTNILEFVNLIWLAIHLFKVRFQNAPVNTLEKPAATYLTIYTLWTLIAIFLIPILFNFK